MRIAQKYAFVEHMREGNMSKLSIHPNVSFSKNKKPGSLFRSYVLIGLTLFFGSGSALTKLSRIRNRVDPNPGETVFRVKILKFFDKDPDPGSGISLNWDPGWKKF